MTVDPFWSNRSLFAGLLLVVVSTEMIVRLILLRRLPAIAALATNSFIWIVELTIRAFLMGARLFVFELLGSLAPFHISTAIASACVAYVLIDFLYYWKHRFYHQTRLGWVFHSAHHSSEELTMMSTFRISWVEAPLSYFVFAPLALAGFDPILLFFLIELNDVSQIWCHTDVIGRIPWLDPWLNTPQNHRRHHARDRAIADGNYSATLMIWDRLFGTFRDGAYDGPFGIEGAPTTANPFRLQFGPLFDLFFATKRDAATTATPTPQKS